VSWTEAFRETVFEYRRQDGLTTRGILTEPLKGTPRTTIVFFPAGIKYRVGPGGLHVYFARRLAAEGHRVLRLDSMPLGESDGRMEVARLHEIWNTVEHGRFVDEGIEVLKALSAQTGTNRFIVAGLCGGALTAQLVAARAPELVEGLLQFNPAVTFSAAPGATAPHLSVAEAKSDLGFYLRKVLSPRAWRRILSGVSEYRRIAAIFSTLVANRLWGKHLAESELIPAYLNALRQTRQKRIRHLYIFSGNDKRWFQFQDLVLKTILGGILEKEDSKGSRGYRIRVVPDANHELQWPEWRSAACAHILEWVPTSTHSPPST